MTSEGWIGIILAILSVIVGVILTLGKIIHKQHTDRLEKIESDMRRSDDLIHSNMRALSNATGIRFRSVYHEIRTIKDNVVEIYKNLTNKEGKG